MLTIKLDYMYIKNCTVYVSVALQGPNHTHSGDGHDKLMDFMRDTFPLAVYGLQDVFSGFILFLKLWTSNSDPKLIGRWYLEHLYNTRGMRNCIDIYYVLSVYCSR